MIRGWLPGVLALDYDDMKLSEVKKDVAKIQGRFALGTADIFKSSHQSYHVYFFEDNIEDRDVERKIINESKADDDFKDFQDERDETRMRVKGKHDESIKQVAQVTSTHSSTGLEDQRANRLRQTLKRLS